MGNDWATKNPVGTTLLFVIDQDVVSNGRDLTVIGRQTLPGWGEMKRIADSNWLLWISNPEISIFGAATPRDGKA
jgi:hypothetical protein